MADWKHFLLVLLAWASAGLPFVAAAGSLVPMVASAAVCVVMIFIIVTMIVIGFLWPDIRKGWSKRNNKVKMPKGYYRKKEEAKRKLINSSNGSHSPSTHNTSLPNKTVDTASWVQGWNEGQGGKASYYEQQDVTMELGDEVDKEFRIETDIVDNEVLDVGPYRSSNLPASAQPAAGDVYSEPYIYTTGDRRTIVTKSSEGINGVVSSASQRGVYSTSQEMKETSSALYANSKRQRDYEEQLVKL